MMKMVGKLVAVAVVAMVCTSMAEAEVVIRTVTVRDPGNMPDDQVMWTDETTGYGGVAYAFAIGKYEVTNTQYAEFLNAVAATDTFELFNTNMMSQELGGITRSGSPGDYTYATVAGRENMPVNWVNWYDALRFVNWLHNEQPSGLQNDATTEDGAYLMSDGADVVRKPDALVFLPSEDEWYKAAYYKGGGTNAGYWDYPTQSDDPDVPTKEDPPGTNTMHGSANYGTTSGGDFTDIGAYVAKPSRSAYGTFDQGGNSWEWTEGVIGSFRSFRGGSFWGASGDTMHAASRNDYNPTNHNGSVGFRIATVVGPLPVPTVSEWGFVVMTLSTLLAGTLVLARRRPSAV